MAIRFVVDSREKMPYKLPNPIIEKMPVGDYTIQGYEDMMVIERKSFEDLYRCLTSSLARLRSQLRRMGPFDYKALIVDTTVSAILMGHPMCKLKGETAFERLIGLVHQYDIPIYFADRHGTIVCRTLLCLWWKEEHSIVAGKGG